MKNELWKWTDINDWKENPPGNDYNCAGPGEIVYVKGDQNIKAGAGENACRLILFYGKRNKEAAILHTNQLLQDEYKDLTKTLLGKINFEPKKTKVYLCGDEGDDEHKEWNNQIEIYLMYLGYQVSRVIGGKEKNINVNPFLKKLKITDRSGFDLSITIKPKQEFSFKLTNIQTTENILLKARYLPITITKIILTSPSEKTSDEWATIITKSQIKTVSINQESGHQEEEIHLLLEYYSSKHVQPVLEPRLILPQQDFYFQNNLSDCELQITLISGDSETEFTFYYEQ